MTTGSSMCTGRPHSTGFNYRDAELTPDGLLQLSLKPNTRGARVKAKGKGANLSLPRLCGLSAAASSAGLRDGTRRFYFSSTTGLSFVPAAATREALRKSLDVVEEERVERWRGEVGDG
jgi:hypothetical protein